MSVVSAILDHELARTVMSYSASHRAAPAFVMHMAMSQRRTATARESLVGARLKRCRGVEEGLEGTITTTTLTNSTLDPATSQFRPTTSSK